MPDPTERPNPDDEPTPALTSNFLISFDLADEDEPQVDVVRLDE